MITGIRFYKAAANTGTHTGSLWSESGTLLARVTFANESASGWQYQELPTPIPISANTTYVVSYHTDVGFYSASMAYFANSAFEDGSLRALSNGERGENGVYRYGSSVFPDRSSNATNYWVDVVFEVTP